MKKQQTQAQKDSETIFKLGKILEEIGEPNKAIDFLKKAIQIDPNNVPLLNSLAYNQCASKLLKQAIGNYKIGIKMLSQNLPSMKGKGKVSEIMQSNLYNNMANAYKYQKKYEMAIINYEQAIKLNDQNSLFYVNCALCLAQPEIENYSKAFNYLSYAEKLMLKEQSCNPYVFEEVQQFKNQIDEWNFKKSHGYLSQKDREKLKEQMRLLENNINTLFQRDIQQAKCQYKVNVTGKQKQVKICQIWRQKKMNLQNISEVDGIVFDLYQQEGEENFAFIPFNFIRHTLNRITSNWLSMAKIEEELLSCLEPMLKKFPATAESPIKLNSTIKSFEDKENRPNLFNKAYFKTYEHLLGQILEVNQKAKKDYPKFNQFLKSICLEKGYNFKSGLKFPETENVTAKSKVMIRVVEKLFKEIKDYKEKMLQNLDKLVTERSSISQITANLFRVWRQTIEQILTNRIDKKIQTNCYIYDFMRGKCMFHSINDIEFVAQKIINECETAGYKIIEVDNRFEKNTKDLVIKILINETVGELQLCLEFDSKMNQFNHGLYEIKRSPGGILFGCLLWFGKLQGLMIMKKLRLMLNEIKNVLESNKELYNAKLSIEYVLKQNDKLSKGLD